MNRVDRDDDRRWRVADVMDFEHHVRRAATTATVTDIDRAAAASRTDDRRVVFRHWLALMRTGGEGPGRRYERGRRCVTLGAALLGFVVGFLLVGALVAKSASEPINAPLFFGATVGVQLGVLAAALVAWVLQRAGIGSGGVRAVVLATMGLASRLTDRLSGTRRAAVRARWAELDLRSARLAPLIGCDALLVTQVFAIAFNVGLLVALLFVYLPFTDLRFGWQSTYSFTADGIATWVRIVSSPWSWGAPTLAPAADAIALTRYARGQLADTLPADAARAWWPFLVTSIVVYGLAIRLAVFVVVHAWRQRRLARLAFDSPDANLLWRKLKGALIVADGAEPAAGGAAADPKQTTHERLDLLVVDRELSIDRWRTRVEASFGMPARIVSADIDDDAVATDLVTSGAVAVLVAATRDPIVAIAAFLRALTTSTRDVTVVLVATTDVSDARMAIWRRFVAIERLHVSVQGLA